MLERVGEGRSRTLSNLDDKCQALAGNKKEIDGLASRGTWRIVDRSQIPRGSKILGSRFILSFKNSDTPNPRYKARLVAQGHRDADKPYMVHDSTTIRALSLGIILAIVAHFGFRLSSKDVDQAYLQSKKKFRTSVFMTPPPQIMLDRNSILELQLLLYGLHDAAELWHATLHDHVTFDLGLRAIVGDSSLYYQHRDGNLVGILGTYVDDIVGAGYSTFIAVADRI